ncbi:MAG: hypothetical protein U0821_10850 [Chloroflexota bacterium]
MRSVRKTMAVAAWGVALGMLLNAVLASGSTGIARAQSGPIGFAVRSDVDDKLYSINLSTGVATAIGAVGFSDVDGLSFGCGSVLFGIDEATDSLIRINTTTGAGTAIGNTGVINGNVNDVGLTFDSQGRLFMAAEEGQRLFRVNPTTGAGTLVGSTGAAAVTGLAARGTTLFGLNTQGPSSLVTLNPATGASTTVGALVNVTVSDDGGLDFDSSGTLWGIEDGGQIFTVNTSTGVATPVATTLSGFDTLAIDTSAPCGGGGNANAGVFDPNNDDEKKKKETEEQKQQRERTNRHGLDEYRTEGNVISHGTDDDGAFVMIANRDGLVKLRLGKQVGKITVCVGDYLEASGVKQHELLYEAEDVTVSKKSRSGNCITAN